MGNAKDIQPFDIHRLLMGETPWWFLVEILVRACLIYAILLVAMRVMGKRVAGQMSLSEMVVIVTLGAAVGVPMQAQDRGMLPAVVILAVAFVFQRGLSIWAYKNRKVEFITQGDVSVLAQDGRLFLDSMRAAALSRERLFSMLRVQGLEHLGQVRRIYFETTGSISVYRLRKTRPGLSILPTFDDEFRGLDLSQARQFACLNCGYVSEAESEPEEACKYCHAHRWTPAVIEVCLFEEREERKAEEASSR